MSGPLVVLGDTLLDVDIAGTSRRSVPDAASAPVVDVADGVRRPGGAGLAALLAAADGVPVRLVTALANDEEGHWLAATLAERVELVAGPALGPSCLKTRVLDRGRPLLRLDHGLSTCAGATDTMLDALRDAGAVVVADYGRGITGDPGVVQVLCELSGQVPVVWDPHPRGRIPVPGCTLVTPNLAEARRALRPREFSSEAAEGGLAAAPRLR
ncbi:MAG: D-beta-D-heptose 1-phosphate adenosyltransferase, partial [Pseudonocardia sp.]|nr:D-beta-D-heptose 1-phosphate adenosyltransferase [Pseudonocardia sp.]MBO0876034.1 D-beta-D-heptose 1-phosphate adenosyltransferase [Pseudonocardia sp.]